MNGFDDGQEDIVGGGGLRNGEDAMLQTQVNEDFPPAGMAWQRVANASTNRAEQERMTLAQQGFDQNMALSQRLAEERKNAQLQKLRTGAFIQSMVERDGSFDPDMIPEMQRQLGDPSFAGAYMRNRGQANEEYVMLSNTGKTARDLSPQLYSQMMANGGTLTDRNNGMSYRLMPNGMLCVEQVVPDEQRLRLYQDAGLGDRTLQGQTRLYERMLRTSTPETLAQRGIVDPNAGVRSVGSTTIKGSLANRLLGRTEKPSRVSFFSADGKGGFRSGAVDRGTGENWMTESPVAGQWKMLSSGNKDTKGNVVEKARWENGVTGEVIMLDPGESPSARTSRLEDAKVREADAKARESDAKGRLYDAQAKSGGFRPGADYSGKNVASIISSILKNDTDGSMKKMMQENPESFYDMVMKAAGGDGNGGGDVAKGGSNGGSGKNTPADTLGERLKAADLRKKGIGGIVSTKGGDMPASSSPAAENANTQIESKSDFDKENERLVSEFKKYGGTVNSDGSFKLGHTDVLPAGDTTDISDRKGISRELVDLQKKLFDNKSLSDESERAEEERIRGELAKEYAGNEKGLDKAVKSAMSVWRDKQRKKTRTGWSDIDTFVVTP